MPEDKSRKKNLIFLTIVLIIATGYYLFVAQGSPQFRFSAENRVFSFQGPKNTRAVFSLDTLTALELYDGAEAAWGTPVAGGTVWGGYHYGTWRNEALGEYEAFVTERFHTYLIAKDGEKTAIFNTENAEVTRSLYTQLLAFWQGNAGTDPE